MNSLMTSIPCLFIGLAATAGTGVAPGLIWQFGGNTPFDTTAQLARTAEWLGTPGYGKGVDFYSVDAQAVVKSFPADGIGSDVTLALFFRCNELPKSRATGEPGTGALFRYGDQWQGRVGASGTVYVGMSNTAGEVKGISSTGKIELNKWHHLAAVWSTKDKRFIEYLDGAQVGLRTDGITAPGQLKGQTLVFGGGSNGGFFCGTIADVRLYKRALTPAEVASLAAMNEETFTAKPNFPELYSFITEPISDRPILPTTRISAEFMGKEITFTATPGEYEPASFVLRPTRDMDNVTFALSNLSGKSGTLSAAALDLKLVKCWYQGPAAWRNEAPGKSPNVMVPELMLNDYDLVRVDEQQQKNFLRYGNAAGKAKHAGGTKYVDVSDKTDNNKFTPFTDITKYPVYDAATLQPLPLKKDRNQQFFLTLHVPNDAVAGVYTGSIKISSHHQAVAELVVNVKVLPFKLVDARTFYNPDKKFMTSVYYNACLWDGGDGIAGLPSTIRNAMQVKAELVDLVAHGIMYPTSFQLNTGEIGDPQFQKLFREHLKLRKDAGLTDRPIYLISNPKINLPQNLPATPEGLAQLTARAVMVMNIVEEELGHRDVYFYGVDEAKGDVMKAQIPFFQAIRQAGAKVFCAGYHAETVPPGNFAVVGDVQDLLICAAESTAEEAAKWHSKGHDVWCYAYPQSGCENPEVFRRNFGLVVYKSNYDGAATFSYYLGFGHPWNDFDSTLQRDLNFVYPTADGVVDTIAFEGYREGYDDIRYASTLKLAIRDALKSKDPSRIATAKKAEQFLEERNVYHSNLNETRKIIIDHIIQLQNGLRLEGASGEALAK